MKLGSAIESSQEKCFQPPKSEVYFVFRTKVKEMLTPADMLNTFESDFIERNSEDVAISQGDPRFLATETRH